MDPVLSCCTLCGGTGERTDPLVPDEFYPDVHLHLHCLNSPEGMEWRRARAESDAGYARYLALATVGLPVVCGTCSAHAALYPKGYGMGGGIWEANCARCHRNRPLLSAYRAAERPVVVRLQTLAQQFKRNERTDDALREVSSLAEEHDATLATEACECGGTFSIAAPPRCGTCRAIVHDSPFHIARASQASAGV